MAPHPAPSRKSWIDKLDVKTKGISEVLGLVVLWSVSLFVLAVAVERKFPDVREMGGNWSPEHVSLARRAPFARWDSYWYESIAERGYEGNSVGKMHAAAFFPLYPMAVAVVSRLSGLSPFLAGEAVSIAAFLGAMALLCLLAHGEGFDGSATARALLWFPSSFFFLAVYSESLFLLVSVACLLAVARRRFAQAALWGFLCGLCRPNGFLLSIPIAWAFFEERPIRFDRAHIRILLAASGPWLGCASFLAYIGARLGDPLLPLKIQKSGWNHRLTWPWRPLVIGWIWEPHHRFQVILTLAFFLLAAALWNKQKGYALYVCASLLMVCLSGSIFSISRFVLVLFPAFFLLGDLIRRSWWIEAAYATAGLLGLAHLTTRFVLGFWVG